MSNQTYTIEDCMGNCKGCNILSNCPFELQPLDYSEYQQSKALDKQILDERKPKPIDMTRYIHNRIDKEEYTKARDRELDHARYWRNPEKCRQKSLQRYYKNRDKILEKAKEYYQKNKDEIKARSKAYYEAHKEEISKKRREERKNRKQKGAYS